MENKNITVGLFGAYWIDNFGDDLMALIFSKEIRSWGYEVVVFGLEHYGNPYGIHTVQDFDEFLEKSDVFVVGGGGFMVPKEIRSDYDRKMDSRCRKLADCAETKSIPTFAVSVGGDGGRKPVEEIPEGWRKLLGSCSALSVRNMSDLSTASELCSEVEYHEDIVWLARDILVDSSRKKDEAQNLILVTLNDSKSTNLMYRVLKFLALMFHSDCKVERFDARVDRTSKGWGDESEKLGQENFWRMQSMLSRLASVRVFISNKLHVGVVAVSFGSSFLSLFGPPKAKAFLENIRMNAHFKNDLLGLVRFFFTYCIRPRKLRLNDLEIAKRKEGARGHFVFIRSKLESLDGEAAVNK